MSSGLTNVLEDGQEDVVLEIEDLNKSSNQLLTLRQDRRQDIVKNDCALEYIAGNEFEFLVGTMYVQFKESCHVKTEYTLNLIIATTKDLVPCTD